MKLFKGLFSGGVLMLLAITVGAMFVFNAMAGNEGTPYKPSSDQRDARSRPFTYKIVDGATGNLAAGSTVDASGVTRATFYMQDTGGTSTVTPQVSPDSGTTWMDLNAVNLSSDSSVEAYPQIDGAILMRIKITACSSCDVDVWYGGQRLD